VKLLRDYPIKQEDKIYYNAIAVLIFMVLMVCFNIVVAPLIVLLTLLYFINNDNNAITMTELTVLGLFVVPFTLYIMVARIFGLTIGFSVAVPALVFGLLILLYKKRGGVGL